MDFYYVSKSKDSGFIGQMNLDELAKKIIIGKISKSYYIAKSSGQTFHNAIKSDKIQWVKIEDLLSDNANSELMEKIKNLSEELKNKQEEKKRRKQIENTNKIELGTVFSNGFKFWKENIVLILVVGFIVYLPAQIIIEIVSHILDGLIQTVNMDSINLMNSIYEFIRYIIDAVATMGIIFITYSKFKSSEQQYSIKGILLQGLKRWPRFMLAGIIAGFKVLLYLLLLIIPGIYKSVKLSFIDCSVATNERSAIKSCDYSETLVEDRWWLVAGFLFIIFFFEFFLAMFFAIFIITFKSVVITFIFGILIKLIETYFIVVKAVFYFKMESRVTLLNQAH